MLIPCIHTHLHLMAVFMVCALWHIPSTKKTLFFPYMHSSRRAAHTRLCWLIRQHHKIAFVLRVHSVKYQISTIGAPTKSPSYGSGKPKDKSRRWPSGRVVDVQLRPPETSGNSSLHLHFYLHPELKVIWGGARANRWLVSLQSDFRCVTNRLDELYSKIYKFRLQFT